MCSDMCMFSYMACVYSHTADFCKYVMCLCVFVCVCVYYIYTHAHDDKYIVNVINVPEPHRVIFPFMSFFFSFLNTSAYSISNHLQ
jgi:hypothetical protein